MEALFDCINPRVITRGSDLSGKVSNAIDLASRVKLPSARIRKASYESLGRAFRRFGQHDAGASIEFDISVLKTFLFNSEEIEALRLARADAIVAVNQCSPQLAAKMGAEIRELKQSERSPAVRDRLPAT